eukprot:5022413-Pyramimonas_sp.AAC.1
MDKVDSIKSEHAAHLTRLARKRARREDEPTAVAADDKAKDDTSTGVDRGEQPGQHIPDANYHNAFLPSQGE